MGYFYLNPDLLNDITCQKMTPREFVKKFYAAAHGEHNEFSRFVRPNPPRLPGRVWRELRLKVFARDNYTCQYCGATDKPLECDHVEPVSRGGMDDEGNLVTACQPCNRSKHAKTPEEWIR